MNAIGARSSLRILVVAAVVAAGAGCAGREAPAPSEPAEVAERRFLPRPDLGLPLALDEETATRLAAGHEALVARRDIAAARDAAAAALSRDPDLAPARVLAAEAALAAGDAQGSRELAAPVAARHPTYGAAQVVAGRAAELLGDVVAARAAYLAAAEVWPPAAEKAQELRARSLDIVRRRAEEGLARGRLREAEENLALLEHWAPGERATLEAALAVARAARDESRELAALRELTTGEPVGDPLLVSRRAELELEVGDLDRGLELYEELQRRFPDDPTWQQQVERAKFLWRLRNLPEAVQKAGRSPQLTRAEWAVLLYWLAPEVRAGVGATARIATDVLDHPHRQEIVRVVNLQLVDVDSLRRFRPDAPVTRETALRSLLRLLRRQEPLPACVDALAGTARPSVELVCDTAARCGLLPSVAECLPEAHLSGGQGLDWLRQLTGS